MKIFCSEKIIIVHIFFSSVYQRPRSVRSEEVGRHSCTSPSAAEGAVEEEKVQEALIPETGGVIPRG